MALPVSFYGETVADNTLKQNGEPETSSWQIAITTLSAANVVAQTALMSALSAAVDTIIIGNTIKKDVVFSRSIVASGPAASQLAQRENKLLLRYHGATLRKNFRVSIPTLDLTVLTPNSEFLDLTAGVGLVLKTTFEALAKSPDDGAEAVILDSAQFVGRNT